MIRRTVKELFMLPVNMCVGVGLVICFCVAEAFVNITEK